MTEKKPATIKIGPREELTEAMHNTFTVDKETDTMHRVWAVVRWDAEGGYTLDEMCRLQQITKEDFYRLRVTYPLPDDEE